MIYNFTNITIIVAELSIALFQSTSEHAGKGVAVQIDMWLCSLT